MSGQWDNPNPFLVLIGAPGSGKSSWARRHFSGPEIVSSDRIRALIGDSANDQRANRYAFAALHAIVQGRTELGKTVVVDATNRTASTRKEILAPAIGWQRPAIAVVFLTPLEVCLERNNARRGTRKVDTAWVQETHAMIERDFNPATTWAPEGFTGGVLFVAYEGHGYAGGALNGALSHRFDQCDWMDGARRPPPAWWRGPGKYGQFYPSGWQTRQQTVVPGPPDTPEPPDKERV
jgi:predicted kinase